jgi:hypothetical protein
VPVAAVAALAAGCERQQDLVAGGDRGDRGADGLDHAGTLVAEDAGQREGQGADRDAEVGVAETGGDDADDHLVGAGLVQLDVGQRERGAGGLDDRGGGGGAHGRPPAGWELRRGR